MRFRTFLVLLAAAALPTVAAAQTKIAGSEHCGAPDPMTRIEVGDKAGHALLIAKTVCTWSKAIEIAGGQTKEGINVEAGEMTGDKSTANGYHTGTMTTGDKYYVRYRGTSTWKDGKLVSAQGTWNFTGGTGKLKGIQGKGTYKLTPNADGSSTGQVDGEYKLP